MKQTCKDYALRLMVLLVMILTCALLVLGVQFRRGREGEPLELPAASDVTVCYYIPDVAAPYEQTWLGGEALDTALSELAALEFAPADAPDEDSITACLVIATNDEQITVHVDEAGVCWVYDEERGWRCGGK